MLVKGGPGVHWLGLYASYAWTMKRGGQSGACITASTYVSVKEGGGILSALVCVFVRARVCITHPVVYRWQTRLPIIDGVDP